MVSEIDKIFSTPSLFLLRRLFFRGGVPGRHRSQGAAWRYMRPGSSQTKTPIFGAAANLILVLRPPRIGLRTAEPDELPRRLCSKAASGGVSWRSERAPEESPGDRSLRGH